VGEKTGLTDEQQLNKKKKIALISDNCLAHNKQIKGLRNTKMFFLPPIPPVFWSH
jgi:hypothetical protein